MKLKTLLLSVVAVTSLSGCALDPKYFENPTQEYNTQTAGVQALPGGHIGYFRPVSQCGNNCDKYRNYKAEKYELPGQDRAIKRQNDADKLAEILKKCDQQINLKSALIDSKIEEAYMHYDIPTANKWIQYQATIVKKALIAQNKCVEKLKVENGLD